MRASPSSRAEDDWRTQSQRVTREIPSTVIVFQVVSSQIAQGTEGSYREMQDSKCEMQNEEWNCYRPSAQLCVLRFAFSGICPSPGGVWRTRSVGDDLTSAVDSRVSQSSMPRASSRFT